MRQKVFEFVGSGWGRALRIFVGAALIIYGLLIAGSLAGYLIAAIGLMFIATAAGNACLITSVCGVSTRGSQTVTTPRK